MIYKKIVAFVILLATLIWILFRSESQTSEFCPQQICPSCDSSSTESCPSCPEKTCPACGVSTDSCPSCPEKTCPTCSVCPSPVKCPTCSSQTGSSLTDPLILDNASITNLHSTSIFGENLQISGTITTQGGISAGQAGCEYQNTSGETIPNNSYKWVDFPTENYKVGTGITVGGTNNSWFQNTSGSDQYWLVSYSLYNTNSFSQTSCEAYIAKNSDTIFPNNRYAYSLSSNLTGKGNTVALNGTAIIPVLNNEYIMIRLNSRDQEWMMTSSNHPDWASKISIRVLP